MQSNYFGENDLVKKPTAAYREELFDIIMKEVRALNDEELKNFANYLILRPAMTQAMDKIDAPAVKKTLEKAKEISEMRPVQKGDKA
jgi:hypothetical protein